MDVNNTNKIIKELREITHVAVFGEEKKFFSKRLHTGVTLLKKNNVLTMLAICNCKVNQIQRILEKVAKLKTLHYLYLSDSEMTEIPENIGQLTSLQYLDLRYNKIKQIPKSIGQLTSLQTLDLSNNQIVHMPESIGQLTSLQTLDLGNNQIIHMPESIGQLTSLQYLYFRFNQITHIPESIGHLKYLQCLELNYNQIKHIPKSIRHLTLLQNLYFSFNQITNIPESIGQLTLLQNLDLSGNKITEIPKTVGELTSLQTLDLSNNQISKIPVELCQLEKLIKICVKENPLIEPPIEITSQGNDAILEYLKARFIESVKVYEAKLMIIGEPGAGKTTLRLKLKKPDAPLPKKEETTEGIDIDVWKYPYKNNNYTVNLWDFGGQEIYRSTHQFFMSERVLYVLLADSRDEDTDYFDWLYRIELFAGESPVVIVHNEIKDRKKEIDINKLSGYFPKITEPLRCNLAKINGTEREKDFYNLVDELQYRISKLKVIGQEFPKSWVELRKELESLVKQEKLNYISLDKYYDLCKEHGIEQEAALVLGNYLHAIGAILFFSDDDVLKHTVILNPEWGTDAVYKVIDDIKVQSANGRFTRSDVERIWADDKYKNKFAELLKLMKRFRICYETIYEKDVYILPQLLKYPPKDYKWEEKTDLHFEYQYYGYYLRSIMYHFIVAMHQYIEDESKVWRNCVVLKKGDVKAEVKADESKENIHIRVSGPLCNDFLANIRYEFEKIHAEYPKLKVESMVPCNCDVCKNSEEPELFKYSELCDRLKHGKETIECSKNKYCEVKIEPLIMEFPKIIVNKHENEKRYENMSIDAKGDVTIIYGDGQVAKGKNIKQEMTKDVQKISEVVNELKDAIKKDDLKDAIKNELQSIIEQIEDNDYELKPKAKVRLKDRLQNILQNVANGATVAGVIAQLISMIG